MATTQTEASAGQLYNPGITANGSPHMPAVQADPFAQVARTISVQVLNIIAQALPAALQIACDQVMTGGGAITGTSHTGYVNAGNWKGFVLDVAMRGGHNFTADTLYQQLGAAGFTKDATTIENLRQWLGRQVAKGVLVKQNDTYKLAPQRH